MRTAGRALALGLFLACTTTLLSACGGGGGSTSSPPPPPPPPPGSISFSASEVAFKAAGPYAQSPATQIISGSVTGVTSGTVYVKVVANNAVANSQNGFFTVTDFTITGDSGQASVMPAVPSSIGAGSFQGTIVVSACLNDSTCQTGQLSGSPQTISVTYDVASGVDGVTTLASSPYSCGFALANDGNAIVSITDGSPPTAVVFGTFSRAFTPMSVGGDCGPTASGNGAIVAMTNGNFVASSETVIQPGASGSAGDFAGDTFVSGDVVESQTGQVLGYLSTSFTVINPAGTRAYGYTPDPIGCAPTLTTYDLTATPSGSPNPEFPALGTPITLQTSCFHGSDEGYGYLLTMTPDGATVFIARPDGVVVQPVSP